MGEKILMKTFLGILLVILAAGTADQANALLEVETEEETKLEPPELPTKVNIGIKLIEVYNIDPASLESPSLSALFKIRLQWRDKRLISLTDKHHVHAYQEQSAADQLNEIFNPKIHVVDGTFEIDHQHLRIYPNGTVHLSQVVKVTVPANMDLTHFPFDGQIFTLKFASTNFDETEVDLLLDPLETGLEAGASPDSWTFDYSSHHISKGTVRAHSEEFSVFSFLVHAQRDPRYFIWRLILPLIVIVLLSWNVFWMYEDSSLALGNSFVFLLTVVAFHQIANGMLPLIPSFTFLDAIVFISYGFIIIPTFQVMITSKLENQGKTEEAANIRHYCRWYVPITFVLTLLATTLAYFSQG